MKYRYTIGVDFGTDSVRAIVVNVNNGEVIGEGMAIYPRWAMGDYCDPKKRIYRQHPLDYIEGIEKAVKGALTYLNDLEIKEIGAIAVGTTGSTPVAVDRQGQPLALKQGFETNPNAMFVLWKDYSAIQEAEEINTLCNNSSENYLKYSGGCYSPEWYWAKLLHILREDNKIKENLYSWIEHCDWIPALLTGNRDIRTFKRSQCAAGHKAMFHKSWDGLPSEAFLVALDPLLTGIRDRLYSKTYSSVEVAGTLCNEWSKKLGLSNKILVTVGALDAHMGAIGAGIKPNYLVKVIGTSTCDMMVAEKEDLKDRIIPGISGQAEDSIIPGMIGIEAGQSAFGDVYAWFIKLLSWPVLNASISDVLKPNEISALQNYYETDLITHLSRTAVGIPVDESSVIALDWFNGRRTPDSNPLVKGAILGLDLSTEAPKIFKALVEATAFGALKIKQRIQQNGIRIEGIIAVGGVAQKSNLVMQVLTDVLNTPISVVKSVQPSALGAAICASVGQGTYSSIYLAQQQMCGGFQKEYTPKKENVKAYQQLFRRYSNLAEYIESQGTV